MGDIVPASHSISEDPSQIDEAGSATTTLNDSVFPHITEAVFAFAPIDALMALRVNKSFRTLANSHFAFHVGVVRRAEHVSQYEVSSERGPIGRIKYELAALRTIEGSFFRSAHVLDIAVKGFSSMLHALVRTCPKAVFRFHRSTNLSLLPFNKATVVIFGTEQPASAMDYIEYGINDLDGVDTLVVHVRQGGYRYIWHTTNVKRLVLVVHPWELFMDPASLALAHRTYHNDTEAIIQHRRFGLADRIVNTKIGILWDLVSMGYRSEIPVTVVGFDSSSSPQLATWDFIDNAMRCLRHEGAQFDFTDEVPLPRFVSFEEYEREVGKMAFDIQMNPGWISPSSLPPR